MKNKAKQIREVLTRGVANILPSRAELEKILLSEKRLNVYLGIDPTFTRIHLGHAVSLRKLQALAEIGHNTTFLIGDFTALIGDTSDKESERPALTRKQIEDNFITYKKQAEKILDFTKINIRYNSEWLSTLNFEEIIKLCQHFSFGDFAGRELIKKRLSEGKRVGLHEALYPVMQGYDSYFMDTDLQIGGTDQTFNMQAGRILQKDLRGKESFILTTEFLMGTDGRKMSKTWQNAIWLDDPPNEMYGKIMSIRDDLIIQYFTLATNIPSEKIGDIKKRLKNGTNPMEIKKRLALQIVTELWSKDEAKKAQEEFERIFEKKGMPQAIPKINILNEKINIVDLLIKVGVKSRSEAKRLLQQGAIDIDGKKTTNENATVKIRDGMVIKIGKRDFIQITY